MCDQVRDSVMTRVSLSWSQDNEVTIAGLGMLARLGLTRKDLQGNLHLYFNFWTVKTPKDTQK